MRNSNSLGVVGLGYFTDSQRPLASKERPEVWRWYFVYYVQVMEPRDPPEVSACLVY